MALVFTTLAKVKSEAGFDNNTNINDTTDITPHANSADGETLMAISSQYSLPLSRNTTYTGSSAEYILQGVSTNYGAGLLMKKAYEGQGGSLLEIALRKIEEAKGMLQKIKSNEIVLFGTGGVELARVFDRSSAIPMTNEDEEEARFSINDIF